MGTGQEHLARPVGSSDDFSCVGLPWVDVEIQGGERNWSGAKISPTSSKSPKTCYTSMAFLYMILTTTSFISNLLTIGGYPVFFLLTFFDSTVLPLPNETFMPFVGALIQNNTFTWTTVLILSSIGATLGSLTSYAIGFYGAETFTKKYGKYVRLKLEDLEKTHAFFAKYGEHVILISRFIPLVRQFISIPAGAAKMKVWKFCLYTLIGSTLWNIIILSAGYGAGTYSSLLAQYLPYIEKILLLGGIFVLCYWIYKKKR